MINQPHILLLGDSVFMDSVAESLQKKRRSSTIVRISSNTQEVKEFVNSLNPDLIVYELSEQNTNPIFTIIREQANTFHLAIDLDSKQIIMLHCQRKPTGSMQELCELIGQEISLENIKKEVH